MSKYLVLWEIDSSKSPVDPKARGTAWLAMLNMIKQDMKDGKVTDWGGFVGESSGYTVNSMSGEELHKSLQRYYPYVAFKVHEVLSVDQAVAIVKSLSA